MRPTGLVVTTALFAAAAVWLVVTGWRQPRPSAASAVARIRRSPTAVDRIRDGDGGAVSRIGSIGLASSATCRRLAAAVPLRLIGRHPAAHVGLLVVAALLGLIAPSAVGLLIGTAGVGSIGIAIPAALSVLAAVAAPAIVHLDAVSSADDVRVDLRHQLSAFLDMVTMLLAGNSGHEGALLTAAAAGDGLLFRELRRRMREVSTTGGSHVVALSLVAEDLQLTELAQVASATALSAAEGAPVARTLAAKCSTLRSTLAADQEAKARVRNDKVTPPLVGMALLFMALIVYPALNLG